MFGRRVLCAVAAFAYAAASRKPLTIVSLVDNEPMTKNGRFGGEGADKIEEFKAEIVTPKIKIWNSEDMILYVINKSLRWEADSDRENALWTYVPVSNEGGMLSAKGGLCLFRDEDLVSLRECPNSPSSSMGEYMFKLDIEANPNDIKRCERVVVENQQERTRKSESGDVKSRRGDGTGIKNMDPLPSKEKDSLEPKRGTHENVGRDGAFESNGGRKAPRYPRENSRRDYDSKDGNSEYPRQKESDRDMPSEPGAQNTYRYPERDLRESEYAGRPRFSGRGPPEDVNRRDFGGPDRGDRYFDRDFQSGNNGEGNFTRGSSGGNYGGGAARDRDLPRGQSRDYSGQTPSASCRDDPFSCGLPPGNSMRNQQGSILDENALNTLIQLIKKFQQERLNSGSGAPRAQ